MAQSNFEENSEIEELHIEPTDVMTGDRNKSRYLLYQLKLSMARARNNESLLNEAELGRYWQQKTWRKRCR